MYVAVWVGGWLAGNPVRLSVMTGMRVGEGREVGGELMGSGILTVLMSSDL